MKKFNKTEIEDILKIVKKSSSTDECFLRPGPFLFSSGITFLCSLTVLNFWLKKPNVFLMFLLILLSVSSFLLSTIGMLLYTDPVVSLKRKYGKYFNQKEASLLFRNFKIPLYKTLFGKRIKEFENEMIKEGFNEQMKNEAFFHRVKFFLENEIPEELKKENKRKMRLQEEKRMKNQEIEAKFKKYIDHYSSWLDTEKQ